MSKSFSDVISITGKIFPQKITRTISMYTVDPDDINRENKKLEQKIKEINDELRANRELMYFIFLSNILPMPDDNITGVKIKTVLYKQLTTVSYREVRWIQIPETDKCISYQTLISSTISDDDEQYICFVTQVMNKTFPDLFVKVEDDETEHGFTLRVRVYWA